MSKNLETTSLKALRKNAGLTQLELANQIGVHPGTISSYEAKEPAIPSLERAVEMAKALNCSVDEIAAALGLFEPNNN